MKQQREQELRSIQIAMEAGLTEHEYWWEYTPAQLLRFTAVNLKKKEERMWESAWFMRMILATQGSKIDNIYDLLPFRDPNEQVIDVYTTNNNPEDDVSYMKSLFKNTPKTLNK